MTTWFKNIGPGPLIAAAFIGPGTVTLCTLSGHQFGFTLLWAMLLSIVATIMLQEMAARLGIVSQQGLAESIRIQIPHPVGRALAIVLILSAIVVGNAAYEAGNISGGAMGLETIFPLKAIRVGGIQLNLYSLLIGILAFALLYIGNYRVLEKTLIGLVVLMSLAFLITAVWIRPDLTAILQGFIPSFPENSTLTIIGLIGTTVVPYNLFLHASLAKEKWHHPDQLILARRDTTIAIVLGGMVSMAIMIAATASDADDVSNAADLARGLEPLLGVNAQYFLGIGIFAAGITSAITAPLAAAFVAAGCFGWTSDLKSLKFRAVWIGILGLGVLFSSLGFKPIKVIQFAQVTNGILLPVIAGFLIWIVNKRSLLGEYCNTRWQNVGGAIILMITFFLGLKSVLSVFELI